MKFSELSNSRLNEAKSYSFSNLDGGTRMFNLSSRQLISILYEFEPFFDFINDYIPDNYEVETLDELSDAQLDKIADVLRKKFKVD